jgi:hypothetical protein
MIKSNLIKVLNQFSLVLLLISPFAGNFLASLISIATLNITVRLLYHPGIPNVILGGILFQWLQINAKIWYANLKGIAFQEVFSLYGGQENYEPAFYLSSAGLIFLTLGIYLILKRIDSINFLERFNNEINQYSPYKIMLGYIIISLAISVLFNFRLSVPGINTIIVAISKLKWGFYLLFFVVSLKTSKGFKIFILVTAIEIVISLTGYFSEFKYYVIFAFIGYVSYVFNFNLRKLVLLTPLIIVFLNFGIIWTAIKGDYRNYLSGNTDQQIVVVSKTDALNEFINLVSNLDTESYDLAINYFIDRLSFIEFFALTLNVVPEQITYEEGKIWSNALTFYLKPRLFFPNKEVIDDSEHTSKYTGLLLADSEGGASHSIGFMTDSYIDFGPVLMHLPIFLLGIVLASCFKYFLLKSFNTIWGIVFCLTFLLIGKFLQFQFD